MRLTALLFTAILTAAPLAAQTAPPSSPPDSSSVSKDPTRDQERTKDKETKDQGLSLPVSVDKIREALELKPAISLRNIDERPTFRVQILERQKIEELLASLNFKSSSPAAGGGLYGFEQQRQMFPAVDNPLRQPYAAFNQPQLLTILIENLVRQYLGDKLTSVISKAERARAEAAAKEEVRAAVAQYCNAQLNLGAGLQICSNIR